MKPKSRRNTSRRPLKANRKNVRCATRKGIHSTDITVIATEVMRRMGITNPCCRTKIEELLNELIESHDVEFRDGWMHPLDGIYKERAIREAAEASEQQERDRYARSLNKARAGRDSRAMFVGATGNPFIDTELQPRNWWDEYAERYDDDPLDRMLVAADGGGMRA